MDFIFLSMTEVFVFKFVESESNHRLTKGESRALFTPFGLLVPIHKLTIKAIKIATKAPVSV